MAVTLEPPTQRRLEAPHLPALPSPASTSLAGPLFQKADARAMLAVGAVCFILGSYGLSRLTMQTGTGHVSSGR